jgi:hypothetical protein
LGRKSSVGRWYGRRVRHSCGDVDEVARWKEIEEVEQVGQVDMAAYGSTGYMDRGRDGERRLAEDRWHDDR